MDGYDVREDDLLPRLPSTPDGLSRAGNVVIRDRLSQGGMGAVHLGRDAKLNVPVAAKVVPFHLVESSPDLVERFQREAQAAAQVDHPGLMRVYTLDAVVTTPNEQVPEARMRGEEMTHLIHIGRKGVA